MTWTWPSATIGSLIALIVLIADIILMLMGQIETPEALVIAALAGIRL